MDRDPLRDLTDSIAGGDSAGVDAALAAAGAAGRASEVRAAALAGLERARAALRTDRLPVAELLACLDLATRALASAPAPVAAAAPSIALGVVAGDPHDLGKEIVATVYRAHGLRVIDLGRDVSRAAFVAAVDAHAPDLLGLSAMMSTTMAEMKEIVRAVRARRPATRVLVGGAPLTAALAHDYGADGYAESALTLIEVTREVLTRPPGDRW
jgi:5-methyltetrahydrofolate--homocysteine methyltransferase